MQQLGKFTVEEKKTSFHLTNRAAFAGVHPRRNYLIVNIVSDYPIGSPRIIKQEQVSAHRFHNEVKIETDSDIDTELMDWLKNAYNLTA